MPEIYRLENTIQGYDWGSTAALAELLGKEPSGEPQAELWMGAHASAPSKARVGNRWIFLRDLPWGEALPYLFKVLAVERPLSIQAHPDRAQAIEGCRREDAAGVARDAPERNYRDDRPKPEIVYALTPFWMLGGFRPPGEILGLLERFGLRALLGEAEALGGSSESEGLERFVRALLELDGARLATVLEVLKKRAAELADGDPEARWILRLDETYPGDRGVLAPLFLHLACLEPGEVVYTGPGVLHTYLSGLAVELMTSSDNVVRGGLTSKHRDVPELMRILRFEPGAPRALRPDRSRPGIERFEVPGAGLVLSVLELETGRPILGHAEQGAEILLCTEGSGVLSADGREVFEVRRGDSFAVAAGSYRLEGEGRLFRAGVTAN